MKKMLISALGLGNGSDVDPDL